MCIRDRAPVEHPGGHAREDEEEEREELEVDVVVILKKFCLIENQTLR